MKPYRPTADELAAAIHKTVPPVVASGLRLLFCGINPGLYSAAVGHHFARPGNRFWPAVYQSGFTSRLLSPFDETELLSVGVGITNMVDRATARADELTAEELREGRLRLLALVEEYRPRVIAILGVTAFRSAFERPKAQMGLQPDTIADRPIWVLPNPSGLNAHALLPRLTEQFTELRLSLEEFQG